MIPFPFSFSIRLFISLFLVSTVAKAAIDKNAVNQYMDKKLKAISEDSSWKEFVASNATLFPEVKKEADVVVTKEIAEIKGQSYTLGIGHRQVFIKADIEKVKKIFNNVQLFQALYGLDKSAVVDDGKLAQGHFRARIFKEISLIPNQDYILEYESHQSGKIWFQRAVLVEDKENFALRDNLKTLEPAPGGVIFREVSILYPLKWYVRFMGPSARGVMNKELGKITDSVKCLAEKKEEPTPDLASECWSYAESIKRD